MHCVTSERRHVRGERWGKPLAQTDRPKTGAGLADAAGRVRAHLHRHRDCCRAISPRRSCKTPRRRKASPSSDWISASIVRRSCATRNGCSARCAATSAIRSPTAATCWKRSRRASATRCSSPPMPRWSRCRSRSCSASPRRSGRAASSTGSINLLTLMTISVPDYFVAYLLIIFVAVDLGLFPSLANVTPDTPFGERLYVAFLPMVTLVDERARPHDADDARLRARGHGEPLHRNVDPQGPDQDPHRSAARAAQRAGADHFGRSR